MIYNMAIIIAVIVGFLILGGLFETIRILIECVNTHTENFNIINQRVSRIENLIEKK